MSDSKGPLLEEVTSEFFRDAGHYTLRSVPFRFEQNEVTDVDVWTYHRQSPNLRVIGVVDVKNKRSPKVFERILWVKGLQAALKCDSASVVTTDNNPSSAAFATAVGASVIPKAFLASAVATPASDKRLTFEQFTDQVLAYPGNKADGDWNGILAGAKSSLVSTGGFPAFNRATLAMKFYLERLEVRQQHQECALRCALLAASIASIALDMALTNLAYSVRSVRYNKIIEGVTYGDSGDGRARQSLEAAMAVIADSSSNGKAIAAKARADLDRRLRAIRADVIAEYFMRDSNSNSLFTSAIELESAAHSKTPSAVGNLSIEARSVLGCFADYLNIRRTVLPIASEPDDLHPDASGGKVETNSAPNQTEDRVDDKPKQAGLL